MVYDMFVKDMSKFRHLVNEDFGLRAQDGDAHLPQFSWSVNTQNIPPVPTHLHLPTFHHTCVHDPPAHSTRAQPLAPEVSRRPDTKTKDTATDTLLMGTDVAHC